MHDLESLNDPDYRHFTLNYGYSVCVKLSTLLTVGRAWVTGLTLSVFASRHARGLNLLVAVQLEPSNYIAMNAGSTEASEQSTVNLP